MKLVLQYNLVIIYMISVYYLLSVLTQVETDRLSDTQSSWQYENSVSDSSEVLDHPHLDVAFNISHHSDISPGPNTIALDPQLPDNPEEHFLSNASSPSEFMNKYFGPDLSRGWEEISHKNYETSEDNCKEVRCIEIEPSIDRNTETAVESSAHKVDGDLRHSHSDVTNEASKQKIEDMEMIMDDGYASPNPVERTPCSSGTDLSDSNIISLIETKSCRVVVRTMCSHPSSDNTEQNAITNEVDLDSSSKASESKPEVNSEMSCAKDPQDGSNPVDEKEQNAKVAHEDDTDCAYGNSEAPQQENEMGLGDKAVRISPLFPFPKINSYSLLVELNIF